MSTEQRNNYRCPIPQDGPRVALHYRGRQVMGEMLNHSAGGFAVLFRRRIRLRPGRKVKLRTNAGWCEALVISNSRDKKGTRLGLQWLQDLLDPRLESAFTNRKLPLTPVTAIPDSSSVGAVTLGTILVCVVAFWILLSEGPMATQAKQWWRNIDWKAAGNWVSATESPSGP